MADQNSKSDVKVKVVKAQHPSQINPNEIVLNNARALIAMSKEDRNDVIKKQIALILDCLFPEVMEGEEPKDFITDVPNMLRAQIGLVTLSTAIEYWMAKERQGRIKVYSADEMPRA